MIKFDKDGNKIQEKKIEEKPLTFPKAPELNKHILAAAAAATRSPTPKSPVSPSSSAKSPSSPTAKTKESEKASSAESPTPKNAITSTPKETGSGSSSRVIPIKIVSNSAGNNVAQKTAKVKKSAEIPLKTRMPSGEGSQTRNIPINVEGRGVIDTPGKSAGHSVTPSGHSLATSVTTPVTPETAEEAAEGMDSLGRPISRRRFGSRKKRFSSAYSDSSMSDGGEVRSSDDNSTG